uniref:Ig-like domain-containing protein n=1 Tax=Oncorhynchus mykiss TaxID=8022 RepID=A0A8L0DR32_ONCMY
MLDFVLCVSGLVSVLVSQCQTMMVRTGDTITLQCSNVTTAVGHTAWFKQVNGSEPEPLLMASSLYVGKDSYYSNNFIKDFTETERLGMRRGEYSCNLTISKTEPGDSATYYCSTADIYEQTFGDGTVLFVKAINTWLTCAGQHSVYWFRHGSGESHQGIINTHGNRSDQCEKNNEAGSPTQSCVYNLPKWNHSLSDAGTTVLWPRGEILFGNGIKLDVECGHSDDPQMRILRDVHMYLPSVVCCEHKTRPSLCFGQACWPFTHPVPLCGFQQDVYVVSFCFLSFFHCCSQP